MVWVIWKEKRSRLAQVIGEDLQKMEYFSYGINCTFWNFCFSRKMFLFPKMDEKSSAMLI